MTTRSKSIEREAAAWIERRARGLDEVEAHELANWLADARHREAYGALEQTWDALGSLGESRLGDEFRRELARLKRGRRPRQARRVQGAWLAAAAALVVLVGSSVTLYRREVADPRVLAQSISTEVGESRKVELPDGSSLRLNTDSAVEIAFVESSRRIRLIQGEVLFTVARDSSRPFVVSVRDVDVRALGTAFNLRLRPAGLEVLVTEGKVSVGGSTDEIPMTIGSGPAELSAAFVEAGQRLVLPMEGLQPGPHALQEVAAEKVTPAALARAVAWTERRLVFADMALADIAAEFNRYNRRKLVIADAALAARQFEGSFAVGEPQNFVALLKAGYHVRVEETPDAIIVRSDLE